MPKRRLALVLFASMFAVVAILLTLMLVLAGANTPYLSLVAGLPTLIPGFVVATLAWRGKLPSACKPLARRI